MNSQLIVPVIEYLAYQLIDGYQKGDANVTKFLDHYDFYLVPFHNPDGFSYTQTNDRLWRKNRQPRPELNTTCLGTDGNRNWKFEWDATPPDGGSTPDPCGQTYRGQAPGDTPEKWEIAEHARSRHAEARDIQDRTAEAGQGGEDKVHRSESRKYGKGESRYDSKRKLDICVGDTCWSCD